MRGTRINFYNLAWRWHFYAGLFVAPFMILLAITGIIYLFKPLPGRLHVVLSRQELHLPEGVMLTHSLSEGLAILKAQNTEESFVIGGAVLFEEAMPFIQKAYITRVQTKVPDADTFFPEMNFSEWQLVSRTERASDEKNAFDMIFELWERKI